MRKRAIVASSITSAVVLVVGWQMGSHGEQNLAGGSDAATVPVSDSGGGSGTGTGTAATPTPMPTPTPSSTGGSGTNDSGSGSASSDTATQGSDASGTFTGSVEQTRFGSVQVQITVTAGQITDVTALKLTDAERRSVQISNRAAPILRSEVLAAQSANVQSVSGATYTSDAYLASLQSAIDQAGL